MNCPRCGRETKGYGKTPLCQPCSSVLFNRKRKSFDRYRNHGGNITNRHRPVTLAEKA